MEILTLLKTHWFDLIQTAAIVAGFVYTALGFSLESRSRRAEFTFQITAAHREIWSAIHSNSELTRLLEPRRLLKLEPVTTEEETFILTILMHLSAVHQAIALDLYHSWPGLEDDVREFFSLPAPRHILKSILHLQSPEFRQFLNHILC